MTPSILMKLPLQYLGVRAASLVLIGGNKCSSAHLPVNKRSEILRIHSLDYDMYLNVRSGSSTFKKMAVFLDEFTPFNHEYIMFNEKPPIVADRYYGLINKFFDRLEAETGLEVVIAEGPSSKYDQLPDCFDGRKRFKGKSANLVKESQIVLSHYSTAVGLANLFYKPTIFISCAEFENKFEGFQIQEMARWFGKKPVFIDANQAIDWDFEFRVNREIYDQYREAYIKSKGTSDLPFWQVVADRVKRGLSIER